MSISRPHLSAHQQDVMPKIYWQCESHPALQIFVGLVVMCGTLFNLAVVCPVSAELSLCNLRAEGQTNMLANVYSLTSSVEGAFRLHFLFILFFLEEIYNKVLFCPDGKTQRWLFCLSGLDMRVHWADFKKLWLPHRIL